MAHSRPEATTNRIESLLREVAVAPTVERAAERSEELVRVLVEFYGEGLAKVLDIVHDAAGNRSPAIFEALCEDRFVEGLLALHGLHPFSLEDRVRAALDGVRPYLESHRGEIELDRIEGNVAYVTMGGSCDGCPSSAATLAQAVETAILERVSEIEFVRASDPSNVSQAASSSLRLESEWVPLTEVATLAVDGVAHMTLLQTPVLIAQRDDVVYAYRDRCPRCERTFSGSQLQWPLMQCACGAEFDLVHAGRSTGNADIFAQPFPLVREGDRVRVAIPVGA